MVENKVRKKELNVESCISDWEEVRKSVTVSTNAKKDCCMEAKDNVGLQPRSY